MALRKGRLRHIFRRESRRKPARDAGAAKKISASSPASRLAPSPSPIAAAATASQRLLALPAPQLSDADMALAHAYPPVPASNIAARMTEVAPAEQSSRVLPVPPTGAAAVAMAAASAAAPPATSRRRRGNQRVTMTAAAMQVVESSKYMDSAMAMHVAEGAGAGCGSLSLRKFVRQQKPPPTAPWFKNFGGEAESKEMLQIIAAPMSANSSRPEGRRPVQHFSEAPRRSVERNAGVLVLGPGDSGKLAALYEDVAAEAGSECTNSSSGMSGERRSSEEDARRHCIPSSSPGGAYTKHFESERKARWTMKRDQSWLGLDVASSVGDFESTVIEVLPYQPSSKDLATVASPVDSISSDEHDSLSLASEAVPVPDISLVFTLGEKQRMETVEADRVMAERARREIAARRARDASATAASAAAADSKRRAEERARVAAEKEQKKTDNSAPRVKKGTSFQRRRLLLEASRGQAVVLGGDGVVGGVGAYRA